MATVKLSDKQKETALKIVKVGRSLGRSDQQIKVALKVAYIESSLGSDTRKNPDSSAIGVYQYLKGTWQNGVKKGRYTGVPTNEDDAIQAFYRDLGEYADEYEASQRLRVEDPAAFEKQFERLRFPKDLSLEEYVYIKHHDGKYSKGDVYKRDGNKEHGITIIHSKELPAGVGESTSPTTPGKPQASILDYYKKGDGQVFVHEYDRRTGHVQAYYRSRPGEDG